jgi:hypothetical protein
VVVAQNQKPFRIQKCGQVTMGISYHPSLNCSGIILINGAAMQPKYSPMRNDQRTH